MQEDVFQMYLEEVKEVKCCDRAENERLLKEWKGNNPSARNRIIEGNLRMVLEMAGEYLNRGVPAGDLVQEANMALVAAVAEYEGGPFEEYVKARVKDALLAAVEQQAKERETAGKIAEELNRLEDVSRGLAEELGREATVEELAAGMRMSGDQVRELMKLTLDAMNAAGN